MLIDTNTLRWTDINGSDHPGHVWVRQSSELWVCFPLLPGTAQVNCQCPQLLPPMMAESEHWVFGFSVSSSTSAICYWPFHGRDWRRENHSYHFSECKSLEVTSLLVIWVMYIFKKKKKNKKPEGWSGVILGRILLEKIINNPKRVKHLGWVWRLDKR